MRTLALLSFAAMAIACDATPTAPTTHLQAPTKPSAAVVTNERFETLAVVVNSCDNSFVDINSTFHTVISFTFDDTGGMHINVHQNINGQGVNEATGVKYVWNRVYNEAEILAVGTERTVAYREPLISQGTTDNFVVYEKFHLTFTPTGEITSLHYDFEVECQG